MYRFVDSFICISLVQDELVGLQSMQAGGPLHIWRYDIRRIDSALPFGVIVTFSWRKR